jgi:hypothetical protein
MIHDADDADDADDVSPKMTMLFAEEVGSGIRMQNANR